MVLQSLAIAIEAYDLQGIIVRISLELCFGSSSDHTTLFNT